jgi:phosphoglucosamine mutase
MTRPRLHGTDGIRGRIEPFDGDDERALLALVEQRILSNRAMRIIGEATGLFLVEDIGESPLVMLGWDRRDGNGALVDALESGLGAAGCRTLRVGEIPTPGLHHTVLASAADAGMMVTASHNPATDSGVKLFNSEGYKSMPEIEDRISAIAWELADGGLVAPQEDMTSLDEIDGLNLYRSGLKRRLEAFESLFDMDFETVDWKDVIAPHGLLLDCSGGAGTEWFADGLSRRGLNTIEVSSRLDPINHNCGAGDFSPTAKWSVGELLMDIPSHRLLWSIVQRLEENDGMTPWDAGQIVAAALDGDGDRCLLIEATSDGLQIIDGDRMCDDIIRAAVSVQPGMWKMAASIESDLGLTAELSRLGKHIATTTAVGDRWLSAALRPESGVGWIESPSLPRVIGTEDSGHLVMPTPCPHTSDSWALVGDGAATLIAYLLARSVLEKDGVDPAFEAGWKKRTSIQPSVRERWTGENKLSELIQSTTEEWCGSTLARTNVDGEPALLLLEGTMNDLPISIAVRNSGTQAKTSISIRFARGVEANGDELMTRLLDVLMPHLSP